MAVTPDPHTGIQVRIGVTGSTSEIHKSTSSGRTFACPCNVPRSTYVTTVPCCSTL
jgi:hypothetical protein